MKVLSLIFFSTLIGMNGYAQMESECPVEVSFSVRPTLLGKEEIATLRRSEKVDILMVIDNSNSMEPYQKQMVVAENIKLITEALKKSNLNFNIAVTTTDGTVHHSGVLRKKLNSELLAKSEGKFLELFEQKTSVGHAGDQHEAGFDSAKAFLDRYAQSFLRTDAKFMLFVLSDTDSGEESKQTPQEFHDYLLQKKENPKDIYIYNFIGNKGERYTQLKNLFQGEDYPIKKPAGVKIKASAHFQQQVQKFSTSIIEEVNPEYEFFVSEKPRAGDAKPKVFLKEDPSVDVPFAFSTDGRLVVTLKIKSPGTLVLKYLKTCEEKESVPVTITTKNTTTETNTDPNTDINTEIKTETSENVSDTERVLSLLEKASSIIENTQDEIDQLIEAQTELKNLEIQNEQFQKLSTKKQLQEIGKMYDEIKILERSADEKIKNEVLRLIETGNELIRNNQEISRLEDSLQNIRFETTQTDQVPAQGHETLELIAQDLSEEGKRIYFIIDTSGSVEDLKDEFVDQVSYLVKNLKPSQTINFASEVSSSEKPKRMSEKAFSVKGYRAHDLTAFLSLGQYAGNSLVYRAMKEAIESKEYDVIVVISDSELYDEDLFLPLSKQSPLPIYSLIQRQNFSLDPDQNRILYWNTFESKINFDLYQLKGNLTILKYALAQKQSGKNLRSEIENIRKQTTQVKGPSAELDQLIAILDSTESSSPEETLKQIETTEEYITILENKLNQIKGLSMAELAGDVPSLAKASFNSHGKAMAIDLDHPPFVRKKLDEMTDLLAEEKTLNTQQKLEKLKKRREELIQGVR